MFLLTLFSARLFSCQEFPRAISFRLLKVTILALASPSFSSCLRIIRAIDCKRTISRGREMAIRLPRLSRRRLWESRYVRADSARAENQIFAIALSNSYFTEAPIIFAMLNSNRELGPCSLFILQPYSIILKSVDSLLFSGLAIAFWLI